MNQHVNVILNDAQFFYTPAIYVTRLIKQIAQPLSEFPNQNSFSIFRNPYDVISQFVFRMRTRPICTVYHTADYAYFLRPAKAVRREGAIHPQGNVLKVLQKERIMVFPI